MKQPNYAPLGLQTEQIDGFAIEFCAQGAGDGLPMLFMHGIGSNASAWQGQIAYFGRERRVIAWNAPGYGNSSPLPIQTPGAADYADCAAQFLRHLGIHRAIIVGQSLGAIMASGLALRHPDLVAGLVLISPASGYATPKSQPLPARVAERVALARQLGPAGLADARASNLLSANAAPWAHAIVHRAMASINPDGYEQASRMLAYADLKDMVRHIALDSTVICGSEDRITPPEGCWLIADQFPSASWHLVDGYGHAIATEAPEAVNALIRGYVCGLDSA